ncbi:arginase family protein [Bacteriovorax sp. Seq25_V]|uniref:arginase family protein n=1 Tax=Bacteriovorax sp. Seq25_V TaxID=1201288 RepID=UPI00038A3F00|nr:arginase family protein [Bacteriovorax sp. Seq25_V]EQC46172.1 arginase family protein [Bacteriovorax sp. Seq25_V]
MTNILENFKSYLCPPGSGVFTVNTAKEKKDMLWHKLYNTTENVPAIWEAQLSEKVEKDGVFLIGVCSDCGGGIQRGANWGPLYLRNTLIESHAELKYDDLGDIRVIPHLLHDKYLNNETIESCRDALYQNNKSPLPISPLSITEKFCDDFYSINADKKLFAIGGDHSVSYPLVKSYLKSRKDRGIKAGILHFDAHTDLLHTRLGIDLCFGSWLTHVLDGLDSSKDCYQFGIRSSGKSKEYWEKEFGLNQYWTKEVKDIGPYELALKVREELLKSGVEELYVSFDIDALDASVASATGTPEIDGLMPHECLIILKTINEKIKITGADMVEIAPNVGNDPMAAKKTLEVGAVISSFLIEALANANN